jgi:CP family cyanate transporter-like MFS transporter
MRADTGLSNAALGLLTTLPLLAFGLVSPLTGAVSRRVGTEGAVAVAILLLGAGTAARALPSVAVLYAGTLLLGVGIALGNVLLPALAKRDFPDRSGPITSLYSSMMGLGATAAAAVSAPLAGPLGWRGSLGIWAVPAAVALVVWLPQLRDGGDRRAPPAAGLSLSVLGRSPLAWKVALFMGLQSLSFYVVLAWLPDLLQSRGLSPAAAGGMLALSQATGILGTALVPLRAGRVDDQRSTVWILGVLEAGSLAGLLLTGTALVALWVSVLGFVLGGTFGLALLLLVERAPDAGTAAELSGMAQSVGYLVAAGGPALFGLLHDVTGGWTIPLLALVGVLAGKVASGVGAGRPGVVGGGA